MLKILLRNSISNFGLLFVRLLATFIMSPIIVRTLGNYDYGIWEIVISIVGYMGLLELGLQPAIVRNVAKYNRLNDKCKLSELYSSALVFMSLMGLVGLLALLSWALIGPGILSKDGPDTVRYSIFLVIFGLQVFATFIGNVFQSFHHGFQRYHLTNIITAILKIFLGNLVLYFLLKRGFGLIALISVSTAANFLKFTGFWILLRNKNFGGFRFRFNDISLSSLKELVNFGFKSFIIGITSRITKSTDSIVIGLILSPTIVTFYMIPVNLARIAHRLVLSITLGFLPFFSELHAHKDKNVIRETFLVSSRYVVGISMTLFWGVILLGNPFLAIWMGPEYAEKGKFVLYIITIAFFLPLLNPFQGRLLTSANRHGFLAKIRPIGAVSNLVLSLILIRFFGKEGVALGSLIPLFITEPLILKYVCEQVGIKMLEYFKIVVIPQLIPILGIIIAYFIISSNFEIYDYFSIFITICMIWLIFGTLFFIFSIPKDEVRFIISRLKSNLPTRIKN